MKAVWQHIAALGVFLLLTVAYFSPVFFEGKTLHQSDMISVQGMGRDALEHHEQTGEYVHWSNAMFGGMPHNVAYAIPSNNVFKHIANVLKVGLPPLSAALLWLLLLGFYVFMLAVGFDPWQAVVGAVAFAFSTYNPVIIAAGHVTKTMVIASIPALIGGVMLCYKGKYALGFFLTLFATGLNVFWNHQQISYYTILILLPLAVAYGVDAMMKKTMKSFLLASSLLLLAAVLAVLPAADRLLPTMDYSKETMRGGAVLKTENDIKAEKTGLDRDYAFMWSYGKAETMTLLIPNFMGGNSHYALSENSETYKVIKSKYGTGEARRFVAQMPAYWGDQPFTSGPVYAGAVICLLFLLGLAVVPKRERWWLLVAAVIGILLSWGRNFAAFNNFLFDNLPLYNKFRTPAMALVITTTAMAMMAMLAFREVLERKVDGKTLIVSSSVVLFICLLFAVFPSLAGNFSSPTDANLPDWLVRSLQQDRKQMLRADAWRSFLFILAAAGMMYIYLRKTKMNKIWVVAVTGCLVLADLWAVDKHFLNNRDFVRPAEAQIRPTENDLKILQDTDPDYRVLNLASNTFNESQTSYFHKSVGGYSPAKLRRYQDVIDRYLSGRINPNILDMLNTRYVITRSGVQYNPEAMGNAWFVKEIQWVNNPNEEIDAIGTADLRNVAVIDTCWASWCPRLSAGDNSLHSDIRLTRYESPGQLIYEYEAEEDGMVVFSEIYYKTWKAFIDDVSVPLVRADYLLRAMPVIKGKHTIRLTCRDELFLRTHRWSIIASIGVVLAMLVALALYFRQKFKQRVSLG